MPVDHAISAEDFWSHYFERDFVQLHRHSDGRMSGVYLDFGNEGKAWVGREQEFVIDPAALAAYDTEADEGFAAAPGSDRTIAACP